MLSYSLVQLLYSVEERHVITVHPLVHTWLRERLDITDQRKMTHDSVVVFYRAFGFVPYNYSLQDYQKASKDRNFDIGRNHLNEILKNCQRYPSPGASRDVELYPPAKEDVTTYYGAAKEWLEGYYLWFRWYFLEQPVKYLLYQVNPDLSRLASWEMIYQIDQQSYMMFAAPSSVKAWILNEIWARYPRKHPLSLRSIGIYADSFLVHGSPTLMLAQSWFEWLLPAREQVLGKSHPATMGAYIGLGRILTYQARCDDAVRYLQEAYSTRERVLGPGDWLTVRAWDLLRESVETCRTPEPEDVPRFLREFEMDGVDKARLLGKTPRVVLLRAAKKYVLAGKSQLAMDVLSFFYYRRQYQKRTDEDGEFISKSLDVILSMGRETLRRHSKHVIDILTKDFDGLDLYDVEVALVVAGIYTHTLDATNATFWLDTASEVLWDLLQPYYLDYHKDDDQWRRGLTTVSRRFFQIWGLSPAIDTIYLEFHHLDYHPETRAALQTSWQGFLVDITGLSLAEMAQFDIIYRVVRYSTVPVDHYSPHVLGDPYYYNFLLRCLAMGKLWIPYAKHRWSLFDNIHRKLELVNRYIHEDQSSSCFSDLRYTFECPAH